MEVLPLGGGQDIGKSCIIVTLGAKRVMLDCGMHLGYDDMRRFPDFSALAPADQLTQAVDCVIITHFHLDHIGALPHLTEKLGYRGPIYMTRPTRAIGAILLEDYRHVMVDRKGALNFYSSADIAACMERATLISLGETVWIDDELRLTPYYAGHVLGAVIVHVASSGHSLVYTGDFNTTADRHLGAARIGRLAPDVLITESTYATTIRGSKRHHESHFLTQVHETVAKGGKVLIPVFALGRAQELQLLLESYWDRMGLQVPIYFSAGMVEKANLYYKLFATWTGASTQSELASGSHNPFDFRHVRPFTSRELLTAPGPCVLLATPGMLHGGVSLEAFKVWAPDPANLVLLPSFCVRGTIGHQLLVGIANKKPCTEVQLPGEGGGKLGVRIRAAQISFAAHTDAKGLLWMVRTVAPSAVVLVHGERSKMAYMKAKIVRDFRLPCYDPHNGERVRIAAERSLAVDISGGVYRPPVHAAATARALTAAAMGEGPGADGGTVEALRLWAADGASETREPSPKRRRVAPSEGAPPASPVGTDDEGEGSGGGEGDAIELLETAASAVEERRADHCVDGVLVIRDTERMRRVRGGGGGGRATDAVDDADGAAWDAIPVDHTGVPIVRLLAAGEAADLADLAPHRIAAAVTLPVRDGARAELDVLHAEISASLGASVSLEWRDGNRRELRAGAVRLTSADGSAVRCEWDSSATDDGDSATRSILSVVAQWCASAPWASA